VYIFLHRPVWRLSYDCLIYILKTSTPNLLLCQQWCGGRAGGGGEEGGAGGGVPGAHAHGAPHHHQGRQGHLQTVQRLDREH
jgi:hypothetical protein